MIEPRTKRPCPRCGDWLPNATADHCPRCTELAELEREIGRAVIGRDVLINTSNRLHYLALRTRCNNDFAARDLLYSLIPESDPDKIRINGVELIAQWRKLHAEGAERSE